MAKLDELYDADTASDLFMEVINEGDYIYEEEYGYESDEWAFDNESNGGKPQQLILGFGSNIARGRNCLKS